MSQAIDGRTSPSAQYSQNSGRNRSNTVSGRYSNLDGQVSLQDSDTTSKTAECFNCHAEQFLSEMYQLNHETFGSCRWNNVVICKPCKVKLEDQCPKCHDTLTLINHSQSIPSKVEEVQDQIREVQEGLFPDDRVTTCLSILFHMVLGGIVIYSVLQD